jgi:hypothetical protein
MARQPHCRLMQLESVGKGWSIQICPEIEPLIQNSFRNEW